MIFTSEKTILQKKNPQPYPHGLVGGLKIRSLTRYFFIGGHLYYPRGEMLSNRFYGGKFGMFLHTIVYTMARNDIKYIR